MDPLRHSSVLAGFVAPSEIIDQLAQHGIALFHGIGDAASLIDLAQTLGVVLPHPDSDVNGVTLISERRESAGALGAGFTRASLSPHTDRADKTVPPPVLVNLCLVQAGSGGESTFVDGVAVHRFLVDHAPEALRALIHPKAVAYGKTHVYTGPVFEPIDGGRRLRLRIWPRSAGRYSREAEEALDELQCVIAAQTVAVRLEAGQGYVIDNTRWLHGRLAYAGERVMLRIAVDPHRGVLRKAGILDTRQGVSWR
ncbi:TauD/TfdA family dioxygenase [Streptomyces griseus]|uniref:TauD/TfdA family dioxygenase n=1 Tax=Streptomyces griseus TaxID=1911 RepID=UPI00341F2D37